MPQIVNTNTTLSQVNIAAQKAKVIESDLPALRARWSDTVRYEIYSLIGDRRDILAVEEAVFEMLMSTSGPVGDLREAHIQDTVCLVCEEYGGPPWFDWDEYVLMHPEYDDDYEEEEEDEEGEEDDAG